MACHCGHFDLILDVEVKRMKYAASERTECCGFLLELVPVV